MNRQVTGRTYRGGQQPSDDTDWLGTTVEQRMDAVWELTRQCLAWGMNAVDEPRLQRSVTRVQRARS